MRKKTIFWVMTTALLATATVATAQQPAKIPRIGFLGSDPTAVSARIEALRQGLRELGYVEGKNILIEYRYAENNLVRFPVLAAELVRIKVDVIVTGGPGSTRASKDATTTIPIVMAQDTDPVATGFVASLARPGGTNITGLATYAPEISGKQLELLKEIAPKLSAVAILGTANIPGQAQMRKEAELAASALAMKHRYFDVQSPKDVDTAFRSALKGRAEAVLALLSPVLNSERQQVVDIAAKNRLPVIYPISLRRFKYCSWMVTSKFVVASSQKSSCGSQLMAMEPTIL